MGAYLNKPITEKETETGESGDFKYGATAMQGWRVNQEDAHNCILGLTDDWNMFAVYDGHGGSEVAKYTAKNFPEFLKSREFWKEEDITNLMQKVFVDFDDVIRSEAVMKELNKMANEGKGRPGNDGHDSEDEADRIQTIEESGLPLEDLLARYGYTMVRKGGNTIAQSIMEMSASSLVEEVESSGNEEDEKKEKKRHCDSPNQDPPKRAKTEDDDNASESGDAKKDEDENAEVAKENGETKETPSADAKAPVMRTKTKKPESVKPQDKDEALENGDNSEDDSSFAEDGSDGEDEEEEEDDEEEEDEEDDNMFFGGGGETAGDDSGTTACVCLISKTKQKVVVANAGDSRAILCRGGKAIDLSVDHKPEDEVEKTRIERAGGTVNEDGRVNGGLNLSRALGDHCYKKNTELPLAEQMISALPDVRIEDLQKEDEFLVVACDGIWNSMESQDVVDFVRTRLTDGKSCDKIAEELCDHCLSEDTQGDGTGCDNMTVIVTQLIH